MSARDKLLAFFPQFRYLDASNRELIEITVDEILSDHAHELAEKIREFQVTPSGNPTYDEGKDAGLDLAADLIDPEVQ